MSSIQSVGQVKIVGAPPFPKWNAGAHTCRIPIAPAFRPEAFSPGATFAHGTEIPPRGGVVAAAAKTLTLGMGELQKSRHAPRVGVIVGLRENVGAPPFPKWNSVIADTHSPVAQVFRPEAFPSGGTVVAPGAKTLAPSSRELQNLAIRQNSGHSKNVGAPTFLDSPRVVRS
jgi:hypothetical protein